MAIKILTQVPYKQWIVQKKVGKNIQTRPIHKISKNKYYAYKGMTISSFPTKKKAIAYAKKSLN